MKIKDEKAGTTGHCPKCKVEFVVPAPTNDEDSAVAAPIVPSVKVAKSEEELEDEFQAILMGGSSPKDASSPRKAVDSDTYLTSHTDDEPTKTGFSESDTGVSSPSTPATPKARARTTAEISAAMMKNTAEPTMKKTGKAFGESTSDKGSAQAKAAAAARAYYARQIGIGSLVVCLVCYGMYSLMSSMMGSPKLPPLVRVSGTITLDGKPLPGANVSLIPIFDKPGADTKVSGSVGMTDKDGHYEMQYVAGVRGAVKGKHIVQVRATNEAGLEIVPPKYNHSSQLIIEVTDGSKPADFAMTSK